MIAVIDYGAGNVTSVKRALEQLGRPCVVTADARLVARADRLVVPGVGHSAATAPLECSGFAALVRRRIAEGTPVLGICLGQQWSFEPSEEPGRAGLGLFQGDCRPLPRTVKSPHVGWDRLEPWSGFSRLLYGLPDGAFVYFTHGCADPLVADPVAACSYEELHTAAVERGSLFAAQFHPEKSGKAGLTILEDFCTC